ncbi:MAG: hypothetical protein R2739_07555 [Chitinophagales bacterium]
MELNEFELPPEGFLKKLPIIKSKDVKKDNIDSDKLGDSTKKAKSQLIKSKK